MIRGIFFDAGGVLYQRTSPTADFARKLLWQESFRVEPGAEDLAQLESLRLRASQGQVSHEAYWQQFLALHGVESAVQRERMIGQITTFSNSVLPVPGCPETLEGLKRRGFSLGIVTDTIYPLEWKMRRLERAGVAAWIDVVACSTALGVHKPDPAIYLNAMQQVGLLPSESAFVGHDIQELLGAHQAGMATVAVRHEPGAQADYYCQSMPELLELPLFQVCVPAKV